MQHCGLVGRLPYTNYPQTRKSSEHRAGISIGQAIDEHVMSAAKEIVLESLKADHNEEDGPAPCAEQRNVRAVRVESSTLRSFTEAAFFQRCAGDWNQIVPSELHDPARAHLLRNLCEPGRSPPLFEDAAAALDRTQRWR